MDEIDIEVTRDGALRTITINRPEKRNALSRDMFARLTEAFEVQPPAAERLTLLRSEGKVFTSGIDLNERLVHGAPPLEELCEVMRRYPLPVVGAVQGDAIAGGAFVALSCDFVIAADTARFWLSLVQIGLAPPWSLTRNLLERAGPTLARELVLLGDPVMAPRLAEANVINSAVPLADLPAAVEAVVGRLAANAPLSLRAIKATLAAEVYEELPHDHIVAMIVRARDSEDGREGVKARLEKRMPKYAGT